MLVLGLLASILVLSGFAGWLMAGWDVWIMPVPIMIGMAIDGFITGSVSEATVELTAKSGNATQGHVLDRYSTVFGTMLWALVVFYGVSAEL